MGRGKIKGTEHFVIRDDRFVRVTRELRESEAWLTLSHQQRWILVDWIEAYESAIHYGMRTIDDTGFSYTYSGCKEPCARGTFNRAKEIITARHFFTAPAGLQVPYAPKRYLPGDWRAWRTDAGQRRELEARARRLRSNALKRKREMVDRMSRRPNKTGGSK